jgi:hypothetical protein
MRKACKRVLILGLSTMTLLSLLALFWASLTHKPSFYRAMVQVPRAQREAGAKQFEAQSLQLYNDIQNEPTWEAIFTDQEVNAWLAQDLLTHFADQIPPEVHEPRVNFELDRITLAFELDQGPVRSVIWIVAHARVPEGNVLELTIEKVRAGVLPVSIDRFLEPITTRARVHGLDVQWKREGGLHVAVVRYKPHDDRDDVQLEKLQILAGQIRLAGRSDRSKGVVQSPRLPSQKVLQLRFPKRKVQPSGVSVVPDRVFRSSAAPTS